MRLPPTLPTLAAAVRIAVGIVVLMGANLEAAAPTDIALSNSGVPEFSPEETLVGYLTAIDPDVGDSHTFSLVAGTGDDDNADFYIDENELRTSFFYENDFETDPWVFTIRVRATDSTGQTIEKVFLIQVTDDREEDVDGDGLTEAQEEDVYGTSDLDRDSDDDGVADGAEAAAGTAPNNPAVWPPTALVGWGKQDQYELSTAVSGDLAAFSTSQHLSLALNPAGGLTVWGGWNYYDQLAPPAGLSDVVGLAAGGDDWPEDSGFGLALQNDGALVAWGYDSEGEFQIPAGLGPVVAVAAGRSHALALKADGTVAAWGANHFGSLAPPEGLADVVAVAAGGFHSLALKGDGTVVEWGRIFDGSKWIPPKVPTGLADVVAISAGNFHSAALRSDGTVVAWGNNQNGQASVPAGLAGVTRIAAGGFHTLALRNDGAVVAWGRNDNGQINVPPAAQSGVVMIAAGMQHSIALRQASGFPAITSSPTIQVEPGANLQYTVTVANAGAETPVFSALGLPAGLSIDPATGIISGAVAAAARRSFLIQVRLGGRTLTQAAWIGISQGSAPTALALAPAALTEGSLAGTVVGTLSAVDPDEADSHTFEWVDGTGGTDNAMFRIEGDQLILNEDVTRDFEQNPAGFSIRVRARDSSLNPCEQVIALQFLDNVNEDADGDGLTQAEEAGYATSDVKKDTDGDGFGDKFELDRNFSPTNPAQFPSGRMVVGWGNGAFQQEIPPLAVADFIDVSAGERHSVGLRSDGTVAAWGSNDVGQAAVPSGLADVIAVEAGQLHCLALKRDGTVVAWGDNLDGQTNVPAGLTGVIAISTKGCHNLALKADGTVEAWGFDGDGQCQVPENLTGVVAVAAGEFHSLALKNDGTVAAWGWVGAIDVPEGLDGVIALAGGGYHSLALRHDGSVVAWGDNLDGQSALPENLAGVTAISAGRRHSLALKADGTLVAWGANDYGQLNVPAEAIQARRIEAGDFHNLVIRQQGGFPAFVDVSPVRSWPGESVSRVFSMQTAVPGNANGTPYSAIGLPAGLSIDSATGEVAGAIATGERRAARIAVETNLGTFAQVVWFDTASGVAPVGIGLATSPISETSPAGLLVGVLNTVDPNLGDSHTYEIPYSAQHPFNSRFTVSGDQLVLTLPLGADFESNDGKITILVTVIDAGNNRYDQEFTLQLTDDRSEDADSDGLSEAIEEDVFGTSDLKYDDLGTADGDKDGVPGVIEYASNLDPKVAGPPQRLIPGAGSTAGLPCIGLVTGGDGKQRLRLEYLRKLGGELTYTPQFSSGLAAGQWVNAGVPVVTPVNAQWERCVVEDSVSMDQSTRRFGRVAVLYKPVAPNREVDVDMDGITQAMEEDVFGTSDLIPNDFASFDLDGDGTPGMIEYAFNLDPKVAGPPIRLVPGAGSTAGLPAVTLVDDGAGGLRLRLEYLRRVGSILTYTPQFAGGLAAQDWQNAGPPVVTSANAGWERCVVEDTVSTTTGAVRFARVAVSW